MKRIRKPKAGDPVSARHIGDIVDAATRVNNVTFGRGFDVRNDQGGLHVQLRNDPQQEQWTLCKIVEDGPDGEADYTDERYWVREVYCQNAAGDTDSRMSFATFEAGGEPFYGTATNLAEIGLPAGNQHLLLNHYSTFPVVMVYSVWDNDDPPNAHHYFMGGGCPDAIRADGICYIDSANPNVNYGGLATQWAYLDTVAVERRILIHWPKMPATADTLLIFVAWMRMRCTGGAGSGADFDARLITADFNPCTVTWNTAPASIAILSHPLALRSIPSTAGNIIHGLAIGHDYPGMAVGLEGIDLSAGYGIEIRAQNLNNVSWGELTISRDNPLLILPGLIEVLACPGVTTATSTSTPTTTSTTTETTTSTTTPTTTSTTTGTTTSTTSHTTTTTTTGTTTSTSTVTTTDTTTPTTTSTTTTGTTTSSNPCVCCPDDTPDQMDVTISGMGGTFCAGQDNNTWRLDLVTADSVLCQWQYNVGGRLINLICVYNLGIEEYVWVVQYSRGDCGCEWQTGSEDNQCDGGSITPPYAGSCLAGGGGGTASWTPVP